MADDSYDFTTDPAFLQASTQDKIGYLSHIDADFAKAPYQDQLGYIGHLTGTPVGAHNLAHGLAQPAPMQESALPKWGKAAVEMLPAIGGTAGAVIGAPAAGYGALLGGAAGAGAGEAGRRLLMNKIFGEPLGTVGQQAKGVALAAGIGAAAEAPGALANAYGGRILSNISQAVPKGQTGNAARAFEEITPAATTGKGMAQDLEVGRQALVKKLNDVITKSGGTADIDALISNARAQATSASTGTLKGTLPRFEKVIEAAKINSGITNSAKATPQQLLSFMQELQKPAYAGNPGPVQALLKNILQNAYSGTGAGLRQLAPESGDLLAKLTNTYAAKAGIKAFQPSALQAMAASAALHPRTTALASPLVAGAAAAGATKARSVVKNLAGQAAGVPEPLLP